jgi:hypothetical protein
MEDIPKEDNPSAKIGNVDRESSSCFAAAVYFQRTNMTAGV